MTWTKLSDDFGDDAARAGLSDAAFRTHVEALLWIMRREAGPVLDRLDLRRCLESPAADVAVGELLAVGWWLQVDDQRVQVVHDMEHQPEPEVIAKRRAATAERVRRHRLTAAGIDPDTGEALPPKPPRRTRRNAVTSPVTEGVTERVTRGGAGRGGTAPTAEPPTEAPNADEHTAGDPTEDWPETAPIPNGTRSQVCTTSGHHGCGWQITEACRDCRRERDPAGHTGRHCVCRRPIGPDLAATARTCRLGPDCFLAAASAATSGPPS